MKRYTRAAAMLLIAVLLCTGLSGCTTYNNFIEAFFMEQIVKDEASILIGVYEPQTGVYSEYGQEEVKGIELAHDYYSMLFDKEIELIYADNKSDIYAAETAIKDLISKEPDMILGSYGDTLSMIAAEYIEEAKIPTIATSAKNPLITSNTTYYWRVCYTEEYEGIVMAKYACETLGATNAAVLKPGGDDYATVISNSFTNKVLQLTGNQDAIVATATYTEETDDFTKQLQKIKKAGAQVVFLPGSTSYAARIVSQAEKLGLTAVFLGTNKLDNDRFALMAGDAAENVYFTTIFDADTAVTNKTDLFIDLYKKKYGEDSVPSEYAALGFDAYMIAYQAMQTAGSADDDRAILEGLRVTHAYPGVTGSITFDSVGDPVKSVMIKGVTDGERKTVLTIEPQWVTIPLEDWEQSYGNVEKYTDISQ